jgi:hypothetical protein
LGNVPQETSDYKKETVNFRRRCQQLALRELIYIDQTGMKEELQPPKGWAPKPMSAKTASSKRENFSSQVDFCGAMSMKGALACHCSIPSLRKSEEVRSDTKDLVLESVSEELSQVFATRNRRNSSQRFAHLREEYMQAFENVDTTSIQLR